MKRLLALTLMLTTAFAQAAAFVPGQVLTAAELNTALSNADITAGTIDGTVIGGSVPAAGTFTALYSTLPNSFGYNATFSSYTSSDVPNAAIEFQSARGTVSAPSALQTGDLLGNIDYYGYGTTPAYAASIDTVASATFSGTSWPTQFNFNATPVGSVTPQPVLSVSGSGVVTLPAAGASLHVNGTDSNYYVLSALVNNNAVNGTGIQLGGGRGTQTSPAATQTGDVLGNIDFYGFGTSYVEGGSLDAVAGSAWSSTSAETYLAFMTTAPSLTASSEKMRVSGRGALLVGQTSDNGQDLMQVNGSILSNAINATTGYNVTVVSATGSTATGDAAMAMKTSRGTLAAPTATQSGDLLGNTDYFGYNGSAYSYAASLDVVATGTFTGTSTPTELAFNVTALNSIAPFYAMTVAGNGVQASVPMASSKQIYGALSVNAVTTVGAATLSAANLVGGVIMRSGSTAAYTDTTDTATNIVAAIPNAQIGTSFRLRIVNSVAFIDTIAAGTGVTLSGTTAIAASTYRDYVGIITAVTTPAVTLYGIGSGTL